MELCVTDLRLRLSVFCRGVMVRHQLVGVGNGQCTQQEGDVNDGLPHQYLLCVVGRIDEGFEQVDGADADNGSAQLHFQNRRVHMVQPFWLVRMIF